MERTVNQVYLDKAGAREELLGWVEVDGRVFRGKEGAGEQIGYADLDTGKIYLSVPVPDVYAGRIQFDTGKVFRQVASGPDEFLGHVEPDGRMIRHVALWPDKHVGHIVDAPSIVHAGAAFLLLVLPAADSD